MTEQLPSGAFLSFILLDPDIRAEMERLMQKGISGETIAQAISERYQCSVQYVPPNHDMHPFTKDYMVDGTVEEEDQHIAHLKKRFNDVSREIKALMAKYPLPVEGSLVEVIQDEGRLIE